MNSCCGAMPEVDTLTITALAALGIGLTTSLGHCIGMCGPLISTFSLAQGKTDKRLQSLGPGLLLYHLGRVNAYALIGLALGLISTAAQVGSGLVAEGQIPQGPSVAVRGWLFLVSGLLMIALGLGLKGWLPTSRLLENSAPGRLLAGHFMSLVGTRSFTGRYLLGLANGFLPCGPVYAVAAAALSSPTPLHGAGTMAMFGLGTIPVLLAVGLGAGRLAPGVQRRFNLVATVLVIFMGLEFVFRAGKLFGVIQSIKWGFIPVW